jgi:phospholipase C
MDRSGAFTRRRFLTGLGGLGAGAALSSWLPSLVDRAYAASSGACGGSLSDIEHFVFLMQENRSFDHYFGTLSGVRGFNDPTVPTQVVGGESSTVFRQYGYQPGLGATTSGYTLPFALQSDATHDDQCLNDPTHDWGPQHQSWNNGGMDQWLTTHLVADGTTNAPIIMGHYDRSTLPFYYQLADAFTICDNYHCSVLGPTYPNRAYWMSATLDPDGTAGGPILATLSNPLPDPASWGYLRWKTMPEVLEEAGVSWKVYQSTDAVGGFQGGLLMDNILRLFKQYSTPGPLMDKGLLPTIEGDFVADVASGNLPQVSWIVTDFTQCEHPAAPPSYGGVAVANVLNLLISNPGLWEKTAFIVNYDENGGFFDHVPPPVPPAGTAGEYVTAQPPNADEGSTDGYDGPVGLGFRVPCLVISPYSTGGLVYSGVLDHTSELRLLETRFGAPVPNLTPWRRQAVGDLSGAFDFATAPNTKTSPVVPVLDPYLAADIAENAGPGTAGKGLAYPYPANSIPTQEAGPARRQPSGVCTVATTGPSSPVAAPAPAAAPASPAHVAPTATTTAAATSAASQPASAATPEQLPVTGAPVGKEVATGVALLANGAVAALAASRLPKRAPADPGEGPP